MQPSSPAFFRPRPSIHRYRLVHTALNSFPIGLPLSWLGFGGRPTKEIPASSEDAPWSADLDHQVLGPFFSKDGSGGYGETAFFHKVGNQKEKPSSNMNIQAVWPNHLDGAFPCSSRRFISECYGSWCFHWWTTCPVRPSLESASIIA